MFPINVRGIEIPAKIGSSMTFIASGPIIGFNTGFFWTCAFVMTQIIPLLLRLLDVSGYMYLMTGVNFFAFFFILVALPETKVAIVCHVIARVIATVCTSKSTKLPL